MAGEVGQLLLLLLVVVVPAVDVVAQALSNATSVGVGIPCGLLVGGVSVRSSCGATERYRCRWVIANGLDISIQWASLCDARVL